MVCWIDMIHFPAYNWISQSVQSDATDRAKKHYSKARSGIFTTLEEETATAQAYIWSDFKELTELYLFRAFIYWCLAWKKKTPYIWFSWRTCTHPSHCLGQQQSDFPLQQPVWEGSGWVTHNWRWLRQWSLIKMLTRVIRDNCHTPLPPTLFQMTPRHSSPPTTFRNINCPSQQLNVPKRIHQKSKREGNSFLRSQWF